MPNNQEKLREWEKEFDEKLINLMNYYNLKEALFRNRPVLPLEFETFPEFNKIKDSIKSLLSLQRKALIEKFRQNFGQMDFDGVIYKIENGKFEGVASIDDIINFLTQE